MSAERPSLGDFEARMQDYESIHGIHLHQDNQENERGDQEFFIRLPFSDLKEWIYEGDDIFKTFEAFPAWRLSYIKQLSFLAYLGPNPEAQYFHEFNHTRFEHTLLVAKIMETVLKRNNAPDELVKKALAVGMAHDQATPAMGDATKKLDPVALNEEDNWAEVMEQKGWDYLDSINMTKEEMDDAIHNKGFLGKVLDIADRISYVMLDLGQLLQVQNLESIINGSEVLGYQAELAKVLSDDTNVGSIYKDIVINWETEEVHFTNPERLSRFLELRALLNKYLYVHPISQARDMMVVDTLRPFYSKDEDDDAKFTPAKLRKMDDDGVLKFIAGQEDDDTRSMDRRYVRIYNSFVRWFPQFYTKVDSKTALDKKRRKVEANPDLVVNGEIYFPGFNPATNLLVLDDQGEIVPFKQYDPKCSGRIERIAESTKGHILFWQKKGRRVDLLYNADLVSDFPTNFMPIL